MLFVSNLTNQMKHTFDVWYGSSPLDSTALVKQQLHAIHNSAGGQSPWASWEAKGEDRGQGSSMRHMMRRETGEGLATMAVPGMHNCST